MKNLFVISKQSHLQIRFQTLSKVVLKYFYRFKIPLLNLSQFLNLVISRVFILSNFEPNLIISRAFMSLNFQVLSFVLLIEVLDSFPREFLRLKIH